MNDIDKVIERIKKRATHFLPAGKEDDYVDVVSGWIHKDERIFLNKDKKK